MNRRTILTAARTVARIGAVLAMFAVEGATRAQEPAEDPGAFERTPAEDEVYNLYRDSKLITARRKVEALLETSPDSILGHYVLGCVMREAEGNLPEAMAHLGRAREIYETRYATWPIPAGAPSALHREILFAIQGVAGELERFEYQLQILDFYDSLYSPRLHAEHAWPLMRLGRFAEARQYAEKAIASDDAYAKSLGRNALCALEGEASARQSRYEACLAAFDDAVGRAQSDDAAAGPHERTPVAVHAYNAAMAAAAVLRPDEVERLATEGTKRLDFTPANPWRVLMRLHVDQGRMDEAVYALREMQRWRTRQPPYLRDQDRAETDAALATLLLVAGRTEPGLQTISRALRRPDRRGLSSSSGEQAMGAHALLRRALAKAHAERQAELASWVHTTAAASAGWDRLEAGGDAWADAERIIGVLQDDARLLATFRIHVHGGLEPVPVWLLGDLVEILGPGVAQVVLEQARAAEQDDAFTPYYDAIAAEIELARGDAERARTIASQALDRLPEHEVLLQARVAAVAAKAARELDDDASELAFLSRAMDKDAGVIRRMGLAVPVTIHVQASGSLAAAIGEVLEASPRLRPGSTGFAITIEGSGLELQLCLETPERARLFCVDPKLAEAKPEPEPEAESAEGEATPPRELTEAEYVALAAEAFHERAFSMPVGLSNLDLRSLDGTTTVAEDAARDKLQGVLDDVVGK